MRHALILCGLILCWTISAPASLQVTVHDPSFKTTVGAEPSGVQVDWAKQTIFIRAQVKAPAYAGGPRAMAAARRTALAEAKRMVVPAVKALKLTSYTTTADALTSRLLPADTLDKLAQSVLPVAECWDSTQRTLTLLCALRLTGAGTPGEVAARMLQIEQHSLKITGATPVRPTQEMALKPSENVTQISEGPYTGLLIDCSGLKYTPALLVKFITPDGKEFWGTDGVNALKVMEQGVAAFYPNYRNGLASKRIGDTPLIIRPIGTSGAYPADLVFAPEDAKLIAGEQAKTGFLSTLPIVIVFD